MGERQLCAFRIAGLHLGIDVGRVREVLVDPDFTPVPLAPPAIVGLLNLRGQILTVIDGRARFQLPARDSVRGTHLILHDGTDSVSLMVDGDAEVIDIDDNSLDDVPCTVSDVMRGCAIGAYEFGDDLLILLDVGLVLHGDLLLAPR